jgi:membrane-associated phospholipid phosphatase
MNPNLRKERRAWRCATLGLIIAVHAAGAFAQTSTAAPPLPQTSPTPQPLPTKSLERQFFKNILQDQRAIWTSPLHLHGEDVKWLVPLGISTAALISTDRRTAGALHDDRLRLNISRDIGYLGSGYTAGAIAASLYLIGRARGDARLRETGLLSAEALINDAIVVGALKVATQRARPRKDQGRGRFFRGGLSFPSGHPMAAWSLATIVASQYKERAFLRVGVYGLATLVSASRFTGRNHFLSDVLVGSALGYGIGRYVYNVRHSRARGGSDQGGRPNHSGFVPSVMPRYESRSQTYGVTLAWKL